MKRFFPVAAVLAVTAMSGCAQTAKRPTETGAATEAAAPVQAREPVLPNVELTGQIVYQMLLGEVAGQRGNLSVATAAYGELAKTTRDPRIARRAAEIAMFARQNDAALDAAKLWLEADPESAQARQLVTGLLVHANKLDELEPQLAALLAQDPSQLQDRLFRLPRLLSRLPDKQQIVGVVDRLSAPYLHLAEAHFARGQAAIGVRDYARALAEAGQAVTLRPEWEPGVLLKAQAIADADPAAARRELSDHLKRYPGSREVRMQYARVLVAERKFAEARREFETLLGDGSDNPEMVFAVGVLAMQLQDFEGAETYLKRLTTLRYPDQNTVRFYLGQVSEELKKTDAALEWYRQVVSGDNFMQAQGRYALLLARQDRLPEARAHLRQLAERQGSERAQFVLLEAQLVREAGQNDEALKVLDDGLVAQPDQPELLYESAMLAERIGRMEQTENRLRRLIAVKPDHAHAHNALGYSLADRNVRLDEAQRFIARALELAPDDAFIIDSMGWVLFRRGDLEGALTHLERAFSIRQDPEIAAHLGEVQWMLGRKQDAARTWNEALRANPNNEVLSNVLRRFLP